MWMDFNVSPKEAIEIQKKLRQSVLIGSYKDTLGREIKTIGGADVSLNRFSNILYAGIIVLSYPGLEVIEHKTLKVETRFPYIPGLLSFREIPGLLQVWELLEQKPDVLIVDGQGIAHPRQLGIASHFGISINIPTIGCAKSLLTGFFDLLPEEAGSESYIYENATHEVIGMAYRSKKNSNPLIVSPGHLITVPESMTVIKNCLRGYRLPEPTRQAHLLVNRFRKGEVL
jgi:deoxyribonuclease V